MSRRKITTVCVKCGKERQIRTYERRKLCLQCWSSGANELMTEIRLRKRSPKGRANIQNAVRERNKTNLRTGKFPSHYSAKEWCLKSPVGVVYNFRNLRHFVRCNRALFSEDSLQPMGKTGVPKILGALYKIRPNDRTGDQVLQSAYGWTWAS